MFSIIQMCSIKVLPRILATEMDGWQNQDSFSGRNEHHWSTWSFFTDGHQAQTLATASAIRSLESTTTWQQNEPNHVRFVKPQRFTWMLHLKMFAMVETADEVRLRSSFVVLVPQQLWWCDLKHPGCQDETWQPWIISWIPPTSPWFFGPLWDTLDTSS